MDDELVEPSPKELKPCPWCGEKPVLNERTDCDTIEVVHDCLVIEDVIDILMVNTPRGEAIKAWNTRAEPKDLVEGEE